MPSRDRNVLLFGPFEYRPDTGELSRAGGALDAPPRALAVLDRLLETPGELVGKEELVAAAWRGVHVTPTSLTEAVSRLRAALGDDAAAPTYVQTLPGRGYRWIAPLRSTTARRPAACPEAARRRTAAAAWRRPAVAVPAACGAALGLAGLAVVALVGGGFGGDAAAGPATVVRLSPRGEVTATIDLPFTVRDAVASPDGRRLALSVGGGDAADIWVTDRSGDSLHRLSGEGADFEPVWSPDGGWVAWASDVGGTFDIVRRRAAGDGPIETVVRLPGDQYPESWSGDGTRIVYSEHRRGGDFDLAVLERGDGGRWSPRALAATPHDEYLGSYSPDGRWLAYASDATGRSEVWLQPSDGAAPPRPVSRRGARDPFWCGSGVLCWVERDRLVRAAVTTPGAAGEVPRPVRPAGSPRLARVRLAGDGFVAVLAAGG